jgi:hypothetical protein
VTDRSGWSWKLESASTPLASLRVIPQPSMPDKTRKNEDGNNALQYSGESGGERWVEGATGERSYTPIGDDGNTLSTSANDRHVRGKESDKTVRQGKER